MVTVIIMYAVWKTEFHEKKG